MARWRVTFVLLFIFLVTGCGAPRIIAITGTLPPGEPANDGNTPISQTPGHAGQNSNSAGSQGSVIIESGIATHMPSAVPAGVSQMVTQQRLTPGA